MSLKFESTQTPFNEFDQSRLNERRMYDPVSGFYAIAVFSAGNPPPGRTSLSFYNEARLKLSNTPFPKSQGVEFYRYDPFSGNLSGIGFRAWNSGDWISPVGHIQLFDTWWRPASQNFIALQNTAFCNVSLFSVGGLLRLQLFSHRVKIVFGGSVNVSRTETIAVRDYGVVGSQQITSCISPPDIGGNVDSVLVSGVSGRVIHNGKLDMMPPLISSDAFMGNIQHERQFFYGGFIPPACS
jgi:hypothetical protein